MANKKILVVDDEPHIVTMVKARLESSGFSVVTASNGEEALAKTKETHPDLVILDVMMPPPNGFQVCRILKSTPESQDIPIMMLTAKTTKSNEFWGIESGADAYVPKPYNAKELLEKVNALINKDIKF
ncbi:two component transcriptional regulator, winged helix family [Candidatus Omnitrophus magneticus]|uniref:Two component transcriptional regulator, winged helix family n=1 Tax=Candidatus Omnitrophus magneticus TaxID=1609969 RepID=A0A0F0CQN7_9BACT|nr:two component transcriptional regulator, winged helix family [Candidatus Omnitrophus magneticus]